MNEAQVQTPSGLTPVKFIEEVTLLNGMDIRKYSKNALYILIAQEEQRVMALEQIQHKPQTLKKDIEEIYNNLQKLINWLDKNEVK